MFNNSILSYNKNEEIDEPKPISTPTCSSFENSEEKEKFYYSFELQSNYEINNNNFNPSSSRSYSSPSLFLLTNNYIITNNNGEKGKKNNINNIVIINNNMDSNIYKKKNIIDSFRQKNISHINNNDFIKQKKLFSDKNYTGDDSINRNKNKNSIRRIDTTKSNITIKNECLKDRVEFDNKTQKYNIYINNNVYNYRISNKNISTSEKYNNHNIVNDNKNNNKNTTKKNVKNNIKDESHKKLLIDNHISSIQNNKKDNININKNKKIIDDKTKNTKYISTNVSNKKVKNQSKNKLKNINTININNNKPTKIKTNKNININIKNIDNNTVNYNRNTTKNIISLKLSQFQKILKNNGLFNILLFLDNKDIINILEETKNKKLILLVIKSIYDAYLIGIKQNLQKYNEFLEILKYTFSYSKIKNLLKIDITITIRFIDKNNKITPFNPRHFQLIYLYEYLTKKENIKNKLYDIYSFDLYSNNKESNKIIGKEFRGIYLNKQITMFGIDKNDDLINIQPILPFKINDKGIFNIEIYSTNNYFINPYNIKIKLKSNDLNKHIKELEIKDLNNVRINEYESICKYWKNINKIIENNDNKKNKIQNLQTIQKIIKNWFEPYFIIKDIYYENIGLSVYKVFLIANECGLLINDKLNIKIFIKNNNDYIENEIKKNNLLFEKRKIFEIRKGENIIFYLSMAEISI